MVTIQPSQSTLVPPGASSVTARTVRQAASSAAHQESPLERSKVNSDVAPALSAHNLFDQTVEIYPVESVKRHSVGRYGIAAESIYAPTRSKIQIHYNWPVHLLVLYEDGIRREGESSVDGLSPSTLRNFAHKLTFVPAGHSYRESHQTNTALRMTYFYLDQAMLQKAAHGDAVYVPKLFFEDAPLWATATKLKSALNNNNLNKAYLEALAHLLGQELLRSGQSFTLPEKRRGLADWQLRSVIAYIDQHRNEKISLVTLSRLARLSLHHFCRAFTQSLGIPPGEYHFRRRMQRAKLLLSNRATSITEIALDSGYSNSSSFSLAFRKFTGQTPSEFREKHRAGRQ
jgi:AraC family transcriptional regulator